MAWTSTDLVNIETAIANGERRVRLGDKEVEYRTIDEMLRIRSEIIKSLNSDLKTGMKRVNMLVDKGYL